MKSPRAIGAKGCFGLYGSQSALYIESFGKETDLSRLYQSFSRPSFFQENYKLKCFGEPGSFIENPASVARKSRYL